MTNQNNPQASIIVPIYNMERYLCQCLDSIAAQSFRDWECWLVDDGSTDASPAICDSYAAQDSRFRVIHQVNSGVSAARQCALDKATGRWLSFIDPDDYIDAQWLENMIVASENRGGYVVLTDWFWTKDGQDWQATDQPDDLSPRNLQRLMCSGEANCYLWRMLIDRSLVADNGIRFPKYNYMEDGFFSVSVLQYAKGVVYLPKATYHHRVDNWQSLSKDKSPVKRMRLFEEMALNMEALSQKFHFEEVAEIDEAINIYLNAQKRLLIMGYANHNIAPLLLRYRPHSFGLRHVHGIKDLFYLLACRYGFLLPFRIYGRMRRKKN